MTNSSGWRRRSATHHKLTALFPGRLRWRAAFALVMALNVPLVVFGRSDMAGYHEVKVDPTGHIVPWYGHSPGEGYDHVIRLVWEFWAGMRSCPNGVPVYLQHQVWKPNQDDPRGLGGDQVSMALSSWNLLYDYLGDERIKSNMTRMADYWLAHGFSKPTDVWANLPYPYNTEIHSGRYDGDMRAGKGFLQPDKAGSFGAELVTLYKITGNGRYLAAATRIADSLASHIKPGDAESSPWPFRANAQTGEIHKATTKSGQPIAASYTSNWSPSLRLFADLISLGHGNVEQYRRCYELTSNWLKKYPLQTNKWGPFFEDIETANYSDTEINADTMAFYILDHPEWDPQWKQQARGILAWSYDTFQNHEFEKWGVTAINEQTVYKVPGNSHTSRHASTELRYCEVTGDCETKQAAVRRLNWATYTVDTDGKNRYPRDDIWLTDGYGDYIRHYLRSMAAAPELAPENQNHLLRTSSTVSTIKYAPKQIEYTKFDEVSTELLKIGAGRPRSIAGGTMNWNAHEHTLLVHANKKTVQVSFE
jgi:hypothetical protein